MSSVAIITARGGSKRIPRKNIKEFMGKPMISYAIKAAQDSQIFSEIMVSTEDEEIADISLKYGAKIPFMRSQQTSNDYATTADVLKEVIEKYQEQGKNFDTICCIYPCVPFLTGEILRRAYEEFYYKDCDALTPVVRFSFPIQRAFRINQQGYLEYREPENASKRSQDLEPLYHDVGMFYFMKNYIFQRKENRTSFFEMDESQIQDIDTLEDWKMAEIKYKVMHNV